MAAAEVYLYGVISPGSELIHILLIVAVTALIGTSAAIASGVGIDTSLQALGMDIICDPLHAMRPLCRVHSDVTAAVACARPPTTVEPDILVTGSLQSTADHRISHAYDCLLIKVAAKAIVGIPAHIRRAGQAIVQVGLGLRRLNHHNEHKLQRDCQIQDKA